MHTTSLFLGMKSAFILHIVLSFTNTVYIPYAIIYYVQRVYTMCNANFACNEVTFSDYLTIEIIVMAVASCLHIPLWFFLLLSVDIKKNGGRVRDAFKFSKVTQIFNVHYNII